jgi:DNA topoisomerase-1
LFQYFDEAGGKHVAKATDVNEYLHEHTGQLFTAKDFRTWKASALVAAELYRQPPLESLGQRKRVLSATIQAAAAELGNTPTVCRKYYIHPWLLEAYEQNVLPHFFARFRLRRQKVDGVG